MVPSTTGNADSFHSALPAPRGLLVAKPLRRRTVRFAGVDTHVENLAANHWLRQSHPRWLIAVLFPPARVTIESGFDTTEQQRLDAAGGNVLLVPPTWSFRLDWQRTADAIVLFADVAFVDSITRKLPESTTILHATDLIAAVPAIADGFLELRHLAHRAKGDAEVRIAVAGVHLLVQLVEAQGKLEDGVYQPTGLFQQIIAKMSAHVRLHRTRRVPVGEIARELNISSRHLRRIVHRETGQSPVRWVSEQKAKQLRALIRQGKSPKEAARELGFSDLSHVHRTLVKVFGATARAFQPRTDSAGPVDP